MAGQLTKAMVVQKHSAPRGGQLPFNDPTVDSLGRLGQRFGRGVGGIQMNQDWWLYRRRGICWG